MFRFKNRGKRAANSWLAHTFKGIINRLDIIFVLLGVAPTAFFARAILPAGLVFINGKLCQQPDYQLQPGDVIRFKTGLIKRFIHFFHEYLETGLPLYYDMTQLLMTLPSNFSYIHKTRSLHFVRHFQPADIKKTSRINRILLTVFGGEMGAGLD
jgi:ribosomal protein S4